MSVNENVDDSKDRQRQNSYGATAVCMARSRSWTYLIVPVLFVVYVAWLWPNVPHGIYLCLQVCAYLLYLLKRALTVRSDTQYSYWQSTASVRACVGYIDCEKTEVSMFS
jgi:hypothetical protein